jgi:flagellar biogenesis protein FliO
VEETLVLGPKRQLLLVRCDGERFLVGLGADTIQTVLRLDAPSGVIRTLHIADAGDRG